MSSSYVRKTPYTRSERLKQVLEVLAPDEETLAFESRGGKVHGIVELDIKHALADAKKLKKAPVISKLLMDRVESVYLAVKSMYAEQKALDGKKGCRC